VRRSEKLGHIAQKSRRFDVTVVDWLISGLVAGWLVSVLMGAGAFGLTGDIVIGIVGSILGGWVAKQVLSLTVTGLDPTSIAIALTGAAVLAVVFRAIAPSRWSRFQFWRR
jgi:uncharacterized membrane protein YeaQ/YmgE (transglycosylase-associated protein family)